MEKALNTLPVQTYVRTRASTVVVDIGDDSAGTVSLDIDKPSDVTLIITSLSYVGAPEVFVAAIDRTPSLLDFDVILSPTDEALVKNQDRVTMHLPEGQYTLQWKALSTAGSAQTFPTNCSRLVLAIDQ